MMSKELKECPFCGSEAKLVQEPTLGSDSMTEYYRVGCTNNDCEMGNPDALYDVGELNKEAIINDWNTRAESETEQKLKEAVEILKNCSIIAIGYIKLVKYLNEKLGTPVECASDAESLLLDIDKFLSTIEGV
jgi:hypothetical protein